MPSDRSSRRGLRVQPGPRPGDFLLIIGFVVRFIATWAFLLLMLALFPRLSGWAVTGTLESLRLTLGALGVEGSTIGESLSVGGVSIRIVNDCTSLAPTAILWAAMVAYPSPFRRKLAGILAGTAALWAYNVLRILALLPLLAFHSDLFAVIHVYLWQTMTQLVVCAIFIVWHKLRCPSRERI